ncbi:MAG: ABC transporter ATP-binding protein [Pseudomonadota bacterium]
MIRLENVTKEYPVPGGRRRILDQVSLTLPGDRNIALLGRNGAGKSTLLRLIAGTVEPDEGRIVRDARISWPLGHKGGLHGTLTGAQNAAFVARIYERDPAELLAFVEDFAELGEYIHVPVSRYSTGMRGRLAFGLSMGIDFDTYLVDEIIGAGDARFRAKCRDWLRARLGRANLIMVSHSPNMIRSFCNAGAVIEDGQLFFYEEIEDAIASHLLNLDLRPRRRRQPMTEGAA